MRATGTEVRTRSQTLLPATSAAAVAIVVLCVTLTAAAAAAMPPTSSANRGRQTFITVGCSACHGTQGQGSGAGVRLAPGPLPLAAIVAFVRGTRGAMPAYSEQVLSDADLADIYAYLQSMRPSLAPDRIPALRDLKDTNDAK